MAVRLHQILCPARPKLGPEKQKQITHGICCPREDTSHRETLADAENRGRSPENGPVWLNLRCALAVSQPRVWALHPRPPHPGNQLSCEAQAALKTPLSLCPNQAAVATGQTPKAASLCLYLEREGEGLASLNRAACCFFLHPREEC